MNKLIRLSAFSRFENNLVTIIRCYSGSKDKKFPRLKKFRGKNAGYEANLGVRHTMEVLLDEDPGMKIKARDLHFDQDESDEIVLNAGKTYDKYLHENKYRRNQTLMQIVKRKYFKDVPEPCFLTYAAKEQLRYLRESDPETWTCEKLAESFPITITGVKKLLKHKQSVYTTDEDILNHDKKVLHNWKMLKDGQGGPISSTVSQKLLENFNIEAINGNKSLPLPTDDWRRQNLFLPSTKCAMERPVGEFERMIVDYKQLSVENVEERQLEEKKKRAIEDAQREALYEVAVANSNITAQQKQLDSTFEVFKEKLKKQMSNSPDTESEWRKMEKKNSAKLHQKSNEKEDENDRNKYEDILNYIDGKMELGSVGPQLPNVRWDTPRGAKSDRIKEAYIYDPDRGYQHPFGRYEDHLEKIQTSSSARKNRINNGVYQKDDCFYDEDGNFLYRIFKSNNSE